jgi:glyoxylase-like metal-dependent hydrolase (beta-lactamase superfamily II)
MAVNSYVVEGANGVVIVDGMLTLSDARSVRRVVDDLGKPVLAGIVTHAHPDHYAGFVEVLRGLDVPIHATAAVRQTIERDDAVKNAIVGPMMGDEWPKSRLFPAQDVKSGSELRLAELTFEVHDVGPAESPADALWKLEERSLFVGDLVYSGMHAYLADGYANEWLACLNTLSRSIAPDATLYVGHGVPGDSSLIADQQRYVRAFVAAVERHLDKSADDRRAAVVADMKVLLSTDALAFLMELSVDPFAAKLQGT